MVDRNRKFEKLPIRNSGERPGQALVEFAIISFVLSAIVAGLLGIMVLALGSFQNNIAAENAGRVLDSNSTFTKANFVSVFASDAMPSFDETNDLAAVGAEEVYRFLNEHPFDPTDPDRRLYDERRLILTRNQWDNRDDLNLSEINESLLGQYIFDRELDVYRFPGAVVTRTIGTPPDDTSYQTVLIPLLPDTDTDDNDGSTAPFGIDRSFSVTSSDATEFYPVSNDWVAPVVIGREPQADGKGFRVILFHPSQPASMISVQVNLDSDGRPDRDAEGKYQFPVEADDNETDDRIGEPPAGYTVAASATPSDVASAYGGRFGLGESFAFLKRIRPFRAVFETSSVFRIDANSTIAQYETDGSSLTLQDEDQLALTSTLGFSVVDPFGSGGGTAYEDNDDQSLDFDVRLIDRLLDRDDNDLRRYHELLPSVSSSSGNDFLEYALQLQTDDDATWRVSISTEFRVSVNGSDAWVDGHELELRLYRNGQYERMVDRSVVDTSLFDPTIINTPNATVTLQNDVLIDASFDDVVGGDVLQVRVFSARPDGESYSTEITGAPENNWVTFEKLSD